MQTENFIIYLKNKLKEPLPGVKAQLKMAPFNRQINPKNITPIPSAVLILIYPSNNELIIPFIKRQKYFGTHSGQISLPGGRIEKTDSSLSQTALRESYEEIGVNIEEIEIVGKLTPLYIPISNFLVHPFIGITHSKPKFKLEKKEVEYLIEIPVKHLLDKNNISKYKFSIGIDTHHAPAYKYNNENIWGATAMIISEYIEIVKESIPQ